MPLELQRVLGMISDNERKFLYYYGNKIYSGNGKIVDLGCWLGATTIALAEGLKNGTKTSVNGKLIYAYELFRWDETYNSHVAGTGLENIYRVGDDFIGEFEKNVETYNEIIEIKRDIISTGWHGEKIEFLLVDAMKTPVVTRNILSGFYPSLIPNLSLVYHQDFDHYLTPWVHVLIYLQKQYFTHYHDVPGSGGSIFKLKKTIPMDILEIDFMSLCEVTADEAFKYCLRLASKSKKQGVAAAHVMYYIYQKKLDKAFYTWTKYLWNGFQLNEDFIAVKMLLDKARIPK